MMKYLSICVHFDKCRKCWKGESKMQKKQYEKPDIETVVLLTEDILTASDNFDDNQGEWDELLAED